MKRRSGKKQSEVLMDGLIKRSSRSLEFAKQIILSEKIADKKTRAALEHYVTNWRDFTHAGLFSLACEAVGGNPESALGIQAGLTMLAAALDIHDDIIDKSEEKHGVQTVFGAFGKNVALLLGDAFLIEGFTLLAQSIEKLPREKRMQILDTLKLSLFEAGNAHALELDLKRGIDAPPEDCMQVIKMKAASIEADMRTGAIVGEGTETEVEALTRYGRTFGILATLREEFIDVFEANELNQRISNEYPPVPVLYAVQEGKSRRRIRDLVSNRKMTSEDVDELVALVFEAKSVKELRKNMRELVKQSNSAISKIRNEKLRTQLQSLAIATLEDL